MKKKVGEHTFYLNKKGAKEPERQSKRTQMKIILQMSVETDRLFYFIADISYIPC